MKKAVAVLLALVLSLAVLAGCGGTPLLGRYIVVEMTDNGNDQLPRLEASGVNPEEIYIELRNGGAMTLALMTFNGIQKADGTYKIDGDILRLTTEDGSSFDATMAGDRITMEWDGARVVFEKEAVVSSSASVEAENAAVTSGEQEPKLIAGDFEYIVSVGERVRIDKYLGSATTVEIPAEIDGRPVFMIGTEVFAYSDVEHVTIPEGVEIIGFSCFLNCANLTDIVLPDSLQRIYTSAFYGCTGLSTVTLPDGMVSFYVGAFAGCPNIQLIYKGIAYTPNDDGEFPRLEKLLPQPQ